MRSTYIGWDPRDQARSPGDLIWTHNGGWDDVDGLLTDPVAWLANIKFEVGPRAMLAPKPPTIIARYRVPTEAPGPEEGPVTIAGANMSDIIMLRVTPEPPSTEGPVAIPGSEEADWRMSATYCASDGGAYVHFPVRRTDPTAIAPFLREMLRSPQGLIDQVNGCRNLYEYDGDAGEPVPISSDGVQREQYCIEYSDLAVVIQAVCVPAGGYPACCKVSASPCTDGVCYPGCTKVVNGILYLCYNYLP